jgi:translation initiation factor IF-3
VNYDIRITPIRLIDQNNEQVGVIETRDALRMAEEAGLDLVEISPDIRPPVCKIMDYGKFKYEQGQKDRATRAAGKTAEMKEVRLGRSAKIDDHDVGIRVDQARRFLMEGHKVQLVQQFRGREMAHKDIGVNRLREICNTLADVSKVEVPPKTLGKKMSLILAPDKVKIEALKRKAEKERAAQARSSAKSEAQAVQPPAPADTSSTTVEQPAPEAQSTT